MPNLKDTMFLVTTDTTKRKLNTRRVKFTPTRNRDTVVEDTPPIYINRERMQAALDGEFFTAPEGLDREGILNFILTAGKSA